MRVAVEVLSVLSLKSSSVTLLWRLINIITVTISRITKKCAGLKSEMQIIIYQLLIIAPAIETETEMAATLTSDELSSYETDERVSSYIHKHYVRVKALSRVLDGK